MVRKKVMELHVEQLVESSKSIASTFLPATKPPNVYLLNEALEELEKYPEIYADSRFYDWAAVWLMIMIKRAILGIPCDKRRVVENRYMHSFS